METLPSLDVHFNFGQQTGYCFRRSSSVLKGTQLSGTWQREQLKGTENIHIILTKDKYFQKPINNRYQSMKQSITSLQQSNNTHTYQFCRLKHINIKYILYLLYQMQDIIITTVNFNTSPIGPIRLIEFNSLILRLPKAHVGVHQNSSFRTICDGVYLLTITFGIPNVAFICETATNQNNRYYD